MARPKKGHELNATARLALRVRTTLRERLDALAIEHGRSITDEMREALETYVHNKGKGKGKGRGIA